MAAICRWNCSDNFVDDLLNTPIIYTSPSGGKEWLPIRNETGKALYPPPSLGIGPQGFSAYTGVGGRATFSFLGQEVAVYGTEFGADTKSSYTLDGELVSTHTSQGSGLGVLLFHSAVLSGTTHTLVIDVVQASDTSPFTLDWIEYNNTARGATPPVSNPSYTPSQPQSYASASSSEGAPAVSVLSIGSTSKPSLSIAAIAGGVVGGLVGLAAIILAYLALRSRRRWRMGRTTQYAYGEVAQYGTYFPPCALAVADFGRERRQDSDNLVVPPADVRSTPAILVTHADDSISSRSVDPSNISVLTSNQTVPGSGEHRAGLGSSKRQSYSESPPAYTP